MFILAAALASAMFVFGSDRAAAQGTQLFAVLLGGNEVSAGGQAAAGDLNGYGAAALIFANPGQLCYSMLVHGIDRPTAAHIHRGFAGQNGGIVVTLLPPVLPSNGNPGTRAACVPVAASLLNTIRFTPSGFYINVHTGQFPNGALRGQLF
jgi:hypothetical protein